MDNHIDYDNKYIVTSHVIINKYIYIYIYVGFVSSLAECAITNVCD